MLQEALLNRINARQFPVDASNPYKGASLLKIAEELIEKRAGESDANFAQRAIASTDLTELLANTANKALAKQGQEKYSYKKIAEEIQLRDFKSTPIVRLSASGLSAKSSETGEYTDTALVDTGENIQLADRGALFKMSWVSIVNDDLGALTKLPAKAEMMGGQDIEKQLYAMLNSNPAMVDTKTLFHADHANVIAQGNVPSVATVDAAQQLMAAFQDESGNPMDLSIKYLIVPPSLALAAQQVAGSMVAAQSSHFNPFAGSIEVIVSSRIAKVGGNDVWFAVADPAEYAALYYGTMQGQGDSPEVVVEEDFNSKNLKIRVTQPSGVKAGSYKGIVRVTVNPPVGG